jgi:hypothetical protein
MAFEVSDEVEDGNGVGGAEASGVAGTTGSGGPEVDGGLLSLIMPEEDPEGGLAM